jgi:RNA polymerase sigma factor (sigma-70 family)
VEVTRIDPPRARDAPRPAVSDRLGSLYARQGAAATRLAYFLTGDPHVAQDIAQEAFVRIGRKLFGLRDIEHESAYLHRTIVNLCRGRARRMKTERAGLQKMAHGPHAHPPDIAEQDEMWQVLLRLPLRQRAALYLRYYQDLSEAQAAEALGCSVGALKSLVNRGLTQLRARFEGARDD